MKKIKNKLIVLLSTCLVASTATAFATMSVSANSAELDVNRFAIGELETGGIASIRFVEPRGLRFVTEIGTKVYTELMAEEDGVSKKMGMFIMPYSYLDDATKFSDGVVSENYEKLTQKIDYVFYDSADASVENKIYKDGDYYYANGVIGNLYLHNYDKQFVGIGYIAETTNGVTEYTFTKVDESYARSATYIAEAAYQDLAASSDAQSILEEYVVGAYLYKQDLLTETVNIDGENRTVTYAYGGQTYSSLAEVNAVANISFELAFDKTEATLYTGETVQLTATVTENDEPIEITTKICWSSSNEEVATVDANGLVSYVGEGAATITASFLGETAECAITAVYGDATTKFLADKAVGHGNWYTLDWKTSAVAVADTELSAPTGSDTVWFTKYETWCGYNRPIADGCGKMILLKQADLMTFHNDVNAFKNSSIGFWVYTELQNASNFNNIQIEVYKSNFELTGAIHTTAITSGKWTYVEFALSDFVTDNGNGTVTIADVCVGIRYVHSITGDVIDMFTETETLYIADFDIYTELSEFSKAQFLTEETLGHSGFYTLDWNTSVVNVANTNVSAPTGSDSVWLTKYEVQYGYDKQIKNALGRMMQLTQEDLMKLNSDADTLKNGYVGFWVYTGIQNASNFSKVAIQVNSGGFVYNKANNGSQVLTDNGWTYVEFSLKQFVTDNGDGTFTMADLCIHLIYIASVNDVVKNTFTETETLYVAEFDVYKESKLS